MRIVSLVSGGLDSSLMASLVKGEGIEQIPVFVNYGQLSLKRELRACRSISRRLKLPAPLLIDVNSWGKTVASGLTKRSMRIFEDAFLPGRNLMFLLVGASIAYRRGASAVAIGLLSDSTTIFPDQTREFCDHAESFLGRTMGSKVRVLTPLKGFTKGEVVLAGKKLGLTGTYSCHAGTRTPCGKCVACREYIGIEG